MTNLREPASKLAPAPAKAEQADGLPQPRRLAAILALSLGTMVASLDAGGINIALPTLAHELQVAPSSVVLVVTVYQLALIMTVLPFAGLGDRIGHRTLFLCGQAVFVVAPLLCFFVRSLPALMLIRGVQALGAAAIFSVTAGMMRSVYPARRLGGGMALNTIVAASTASLAPTLGGLILGVADWPWLFAACTPLAVIAILCGRIALPDPQRRKEPYDLAAALMFALTVGLAVMGLESAMHAAALSVCAGLIGGAALLGVVFIRRELRQPRPVLPVDLLRDPTTALANLGSLLANVAISTMIITLPFRFRQTFGYSPAETGLVLAAWPLVMMFVAPAAGMLSDRVPASRLGGAGMAVALLGLISLALVPAQPSHADLVWRLGLTAVGFGLFMSPNARQVLAIAPMHRVAAAGALSQTTRQAGQVLGSTTAAALLASGAGAGSLPAVFAAALALMTGLCSFAMGRALARRA